MADLQVILLEDNTALRSILLDCFADEAIGVTVCESLAEIQAAVALDPGAVVVSDSWVPDDYATLSARQRQEILALAQEAPLVLTTGQAWALHEDRADLDNVVILQKPYDLDALLATVRRQRPA